MQIKGDCFEAKKRNTIILASSSPRRREILTMAGIPFTVVTAKTDEHFSSETSARQAVEMLALRKAKAAGAMEQTKGKIILAADTVVSMDDRIFGKPHTREEAFAMLAALSGKTHQVFTGVCLLTADRCPVTFFEDSHVEFYPLTQREITAYIDTGEPMDKAGAYGIQGKGALLVRKIDGDFYNVMGLPIARVVRALQSIQR